jgi:hypothetical protein
MIPAFIHLIIFDASRNKNKTSRFEDAPFWFPPAASSGQNLNAIKLHIRRAGVVIFHVDAGAGAGGQPWLFLGVF